MSDNEPRLRKALEDILEVRSHMKAVGLASFDAYLTLMHERLDIAEKVLEIASYECATCGVDRSKPMTDEDRLKRGLCSACGNRPNVLPELGPNEHPCPKCGCLWFGTLSIQGPHEEWLRVCKGCSHKHGPYEYVKEGEA